jgi:hypothetical protein
MAAASGPFRFEEAPGSRRWSSTGWVKGNAVVVQWRRAS